MSDQGRVADSELPLQVQPLVHELAGGDRNALNRPDRSDFGQIERVPAFTGLAMDCGEIGIDGKARMGMRPETLDLGMPRIAACFPAKDCPSQQSLAPQSYQPLPIKVLRVQ